MPDFSHDTLYSTASSEHEPSTMELYFPIPVQYGVTTLMDANSIVNLATIAKTTHMPSKTVPAIMEEIRVDTVQATKVVMVGGMVGTVAVTVLAHSRVRFWTFFTLLGLHHS